MSVSSIKTFLIEALIGIGIGTGLGVIPVALVANILLTKTVDPVIVEPVPIKLEEI